MISGRFRKLSARVAKEIETRRAGNDENNLRQVTSYRPEARDEGFIPLELKRGNKSLHYQAYAAYPIVGMAVMSQAYGCGFLDSKWKRRQLANLMKRTVQGGRAPSIFCDAQASLGSDRPAKQQKTYTVRHSPELLYLVDRLDPKLYDRIDGELAGTLGKDRPVTEAGAHGANDRMGGSFAKLADRAEAVRDSRSAGLAAVCR